jgi:glycosyltransferase involved in cell wall biosynthesis
MWQFNSLYPSSAKRGTQVKIISSPRGALSPWALSHGSKAKELFWPLLQKPALKKVDCFHATAESELLDIRRLGFRQPVAVIQNGMHVPTVVREFASTPLKVLFLSRLHPKKNIETLLRAWSQIESHFQGWTLEIVGSDEDYHGSSGYLPKLRRLASDLTLERVVFSGEKQGDAKINAYRESQLFVLPTFSENFGLVVAEALAAGTPAIVTKGAPWGGLVTEDAGWWIDNDLETLTQTLVEAMTLPPTRRQEMGANGQAWIQREFDWISIATRMAKTYEWLTHRHEGLPSWVYLDQ